MAYDEEDAMDQPEDRTGEPGPDSDPVEPPPPAEDAASDADATAVQPVDAASDEGATVVQPPVPAPPVDAPSDAGGATAVQPPEREGLWAAGHAEPEQATPSRRRPLLLAGVGIAVLALIGLVVWLVVTTNAANREKAIRETATNYLTALSNADAVAALDLLAERPANAALLNGPVLEASRAAAPLTEVQVGNVSNRGGEAQAEVSYRLGELPVETTLALSGDGGTSWKVADGTADLTLTDTRALTVNGAVVTEAVNPVFPGTYTAAPSTELVALAGELTAVVPRPDHEGATISVTQGLSDVGNQAVLDTVKGRFDECLTSTESRPANCPFGISTEGVDVAPGSVRFSLANDPWAGFVPNFDVATMSANGTIHFVINATATVSSGGLTTEALINVETDRGFVVDLTQQPLAVTWQ